MTTTQTELLNSHKHWLTRLQRQVVYIYEIADSDRSYDRKKELIQSAIEVYNMCCETYLLTTQINRAPIMFMMSTSKDFMNEVLKKLKP